MSAGTAPPRAAADARVFTLPDLGEGLMDAEIVGWRVAVGDRVGTDEVVVDVETAKAAVEVPCPYAGVVVALHGETGERLPVGAPLVTVAPDDGPDDVFATSREEGRAGSGQVLVGFGTSAATGHRRRTGRRGGAPRVTPGSRTAPEPDGPRAVRCISPVVRRLAREGGVDLAALRGTGPGGVIRRADVEAALRSRTPSPAPGPAAAPPRPGEERIPLRGVRGAVAEHVTRSRREIPDVTVWVDVDATGLLETRTAIARAHPDHHVGLLAILARICVHALQRFPDLNARVETDPATGAGEVVRLAEVDLAVAAQTDRGLVVPVVRDAGRMTTLELAAALDDVIARAREGSLPPADLVGGTFTLNNYGVFGVDGSTPIINHPQAALLGVGRIVEKPWVVDGALAVRHVTTLGLTFDHRACDGGTAGGFLRLVADCVEQPAVLLAGL